MSKHCEWCFQWDQGKLLYCFIGKKCDRMSEVLHGKAIVLTYCTVFLGFWIVKPEYPIFCWVLWFFLYSKLKLIVRDKKNCPWKRVLNPHHINWRTEDFHFKLLFHIIVKTSSINIVGKSPAPGLMLKSALWCSSLLNPDKDNMMGFHCFSMFAFAV